VEIRTFLTKNIAVFKKHIIFAKTFSKDSCNKLRDNKPLMLPRKIAHLRGVFYFPSFLNKIKEKI
jgi:hypothetical protein